MSQEGTTISQSKGAVRAKILSGSELGLLKEPKESLLKSSRQGKSDLPLDRWV